MGRLRVTPFLAVLALGGCWNATEPQPQPVPPPQVDTGIERERNTASLPPMPLPPPKEKPTAPQIDPNKLVGLTQDEMRQLIGNPLTVRDEPPAVVWGYGSNSCGLEVFFYFDLTTQTFKSLTYDLKPKGSRGLGGSACLASLRTSSHE